ncbi:MAG: glycan-binding surface protein [Prevotellaceae bacterium]|jgi:hypothetical protein|nr:glycan-binding surface protein [Prevotellaceae bacterium]
MKKIFSNIGIAAVAVLGLCACSKDDDGGENSDATPVIRYVRPTAAEAADSLLVKGFMGSTVAIIGENLAGVCEVWFNDRRATTLNPNMITGSAVIVAIPSEMYEEQNDLIRVVTRKGKEATHPFVTMPPAPLPQSISSEYARAGDEVTITGKSFYGAMENVQVFFPGNVEAEVLSVDPAKIVAKVPAAAANSKGQLTVKTPYGSTRSTFIYRDDRGIFIDAEDDGASWNNWNLSGFGADNGCSGKYVHLAGTTGSWAWPNNSIQLFYVNPTQQPLVAAGNITDYALRFEVRAAAWHDTPLLMWFEEAGNAHDVDSKWPQFHWKPYLVNDAKTNFTTNGKWITVTVPLTDFNTNKDETKGSLIKSLTELVNFSMMWFGAADGENPLDIDFDNFRLVELK